MALAKAMAALCFEPLALPFDGYTSQKALKSSVYKFSSLDFFVLFLATNGCVTFSGSGKSAIYILSSLSFLSVSLSVSWALHGVASSVAVASFKRSLRSLERSVELSAVEPCICSRSRLGWRFSQLMNLLPSSIIPCMACNTDATSASLHPVAHATVRALHFVAPRCISLHDASDIKNTAIA